MAFIGCDLKQISIKHPTLGSVVIYPKAGENAQIELGGITTESDPKGIAGSGEAIYKKNVGRWVVETAPIAWKRAVADSDTLKVIQNIAASFEESDFTFELADGVIYVGRGMIVGEIKGATFDATIPLKMEGGGQLAQI